MNGKRFFIMLLAVLTALASLSALAEGSTLRHVVNCEQWISLREEPSVNAARIMKIPLRATVYLQGEDKDNGFVRVYYGGYGGYSYGYGYGYGRDRGYGYGQQKEKTGAD